MKKGIAQFCCLLILFFTACQPGGNKPDKKPEETQTEELKSENLYEEEFTEEEGKEGGTELVADPEETETDLGEDMDGTIPLPESKTGINAIDYDKLEPLADLYKSYNGSKKMLKNIKSVFEKHRWEEMRGFFSEQVLWDQKELEKTTAQVIADGFNLSQEENRIGKDYTESISKEGIDKIARIEWVGWRPSPFVDEWMEVYGDLWLNDGRQMRIRMYLIEEGKGLKVDAPLG